MIINPESYRDVPVRDWWPRRPATPVLPQGSQLPNHGQIWLPRSHACWCQRQTRVLPCGLGVLYRATLWPQPLITLIIPLKAGCSEGPSRGPFCPNYLHCPLKCPFICCHTSSCIQMRRLTGNHYFIRPVLSTVDPFKEGNKCTFGNLAAHGDYIIDSWSEIVAEVLSFVAVSQTHHPFALYWVNSFALLPCCSQTCMWNHSLEKYTNTCSTLDFCCQTVFVLRWITAVKADHDASAEWHFQASHMCLLLPWTDVNYFFFFTLLEMFLSPVGGGSGLLLSMLGWSMGLCHVCCRGAFGSGGIIECRKSV